MVLFVNCNEPYDKTKDFEILLKLQKVQKKAHLSKDALMLTSMFNDPLVQLYSGQISRDRSEDHTKRFQAYFDMVDFSKWDDIVSPKIHISADGTMAYIIVSKRVNLTYNKNNIQTQKSTMYAWLETWEKKQGQWKLMVIASTSVDQ